MDWGSELWDQFDSVDKHHQHGIEFNEKYAKFVKERCAIELDYAQKLRKLVKSYQPKKKEEERSMHLTQASGSMEDWPSTKAMANQCGHICPQETSPHFGFSPHKAFVIQMSELNDIAGQHEFVAEEMINNINKAMLSFCVDLKNEKKKIYQDGRHQQSDLEQQEKSMEQIKKKYEKESKECERAQAYFDKLDNDLNVTKIDVEKARQAWSAKKDTVESCKADYVSALQKFNEAQEKHFNTNMPKLFLAYKEADERRILKYRELMMEYINIDMKVKPLIQKCLEGMEKAAGAIDPQLDAQLVVEKLKSGFLPPSDKEFEDYGQVHLQRNNGADGVENSQRNSINAKSQTNKKGGLSRLFGNKKPPKEKVVTGSVPSPPAPVDVKKNQRSMTESKVETENNRQETQQKSRTLSSVSALRGMSVASDKKVGKITDEHRSASVEGVNADNKESGEVMQRKSSKGRSKLEFRMSIPVNKKRLKSMFRSNKDDHTPPKIEVSGPITCDLMGTASNDDYLVPLSDSSKKNENPYDQVTVDHGQSEDRAGTAESPDYSHLPPEQRRKKLQKSIDELKKEISKEEEGRKAMLKMQEVYRRNPSMGDADSLSGQLATSASHLEKLHGEIAQLETWQAEAAGSVKTAPDRQRGQQSPVKIISSSKEATSESSHSPRHVKHEQSFGDDFDEEPEPIGTCVALYDFDATSDGALCMKVGESFSVIEADNGDGWTRAMRGDVDGYVPTSYIEINFFT